MPRNNDEQRLALDTPLKGARKAVDRVLFLSELNLILTSCDDGVVRIYDRDTMKGEVLRVFAKHVGAWFEGPVSLDTDVVASVDRKGRLFIWQPSSANEFDMLNLENYGEPTALSKLTESSILVGTKKGELLVVTHAPGEPMTVTKILDNVLTVEVSDIATFADRAFVCSTDWTVKVLDRNALVVLDSIQHFGPVFHITINEKYLASISRGKVDGQVLVRINVFENKPGYNEVYRFSMPDVQWGGATLLDDDVAVIPCDKYLNFLSLVEERFVLRIPRGRGGLLAATVLNDGRIAITGNRGYGSIIAAPDTPRLRNAVGECTRRLYGMSAFGFDEQQPSGTGHTDAHTSPRRRKRPKWMTQDEDNKSAGLTGGRVQPRIEEEVLESGDAENLPTSHLATTALTSRRIPQPALPLGGQQVGVSGSEYNPVHLMPSSVAFTAGNVLQPMPLPLPLPPHEDQLGIGNGGGIVPILTPAKEQQVNVLQAQLNPHPPHLAAPTASSISTDTESEIHEWKMRKVSKDVLAVLETEQVAAALAAFLVNYERTRALQFAQFKYVLGKLYHKRFVYGWSFVNFSEKEKKHLHEMTTNALAEVTEPDSMVYLQMRLKHFLRIAGEG